MLSINKVISDYSEYFEDNNQSKVFEEKLVDIASSRSFIMQPDGIMRKVTRGLVNDKWLTCFKSSKEKRLTCMILNEYLNNIHDKIWIERCNDTIVLEKQMGIYRDMKRKKNHLIRDGDSLINTKKLENQKKNKKLKTLVKIDSVENIKDDVFRLDNSNRFKIGNQVISNLVNI